MARTGAQQWSSKQATPTWSSAAVPASLGVCCVLPGAAARCSSGGSCGRPDGPRDSVQASGDCLLFLDWYALRLSGALGVTSPSKAALSFGGAPVAGRLGVTRRLVEGSSGSVCVALVATVCVERSAFGASTGRPASGRGAGATACTSWGCTETDGGGAAG